MQRARGLTLVFLLGLATVPAVADIIQPVSVQVREQEPGTFLVQWQVPKAIPREAMPSPVMPDGCTPRGEAVLQDQLANWLGRRLYRCREGLEGQEVRLVYPFSGFPQTAMFRVEFLSGEQLVHMMPPGVESWRLPESSGGLSGAFWETLRRAVVDGVGHFSAGWLHLALGLAISLLGGAGTSLRLVTAFSGGQLVGVAWTSLTGLELPGALGESAVAVAVALLAVQALGEREGYRQLVAVTGLAGALHGAGLAQIIPLPADYAASPALYGLLLILGMDAALLVVVGLGGGLRSLAKDRSWAGALRRPVSYALGGAALATALALVLVHPPVQARSSTELPRLPSLSGASDSPGRTPRQVAPQVLELAVQSFVSVEPFEVRHEILVMVRELADSLAVERVGFLEIEAQPELKARVADLLVPGTEMRIDGREVVPVIDRVDFLSVGSKGLLARTEPARERLDEARVGVTVVYGTARTPQEMQLSWRTLPPGVDEIPVTVTDPELTRTEVLTPLDPTMDWRNELVEDPAPTVKAIPVVPRSVPVPWLGLTLFLVAGLAVFRAFRKRGAGWAFALARVALALLLLLAPVAEVAVALPPSLGVTVTVAQARRILAGVLPNVYRAFEFREESVVYDRLAVSVTGETLSQIYLEHRKAMELEERGGARARVEAVSVPEVRSVAVRDDGAFDVDAVWTVGGTVTHFGHRHFRQNRYDARVTLLPVDGVWKIQAIELFDEERIQ